MQKGNNKIILSLQILVVVFVVSVIGYSFAHKENIHKNITEGDAVLVRDPIIGGGKTWREGAVQEVRGNKTEHSDDGSVALFAEKVNENTTVHIIRPEKEAINIKFVEGATRDYSDSSWDVLLPNISLSPDGTKAIYVDVTGVKLVDIDTGEIKSIRYEGYVNGKIGIKELPHGVTWFPDSMHVYFYVPKYEGWSIGIMNVVTGEYNRKVLDEAISNLMVVALDEMQYLVYSVAKENNYGADAGLFVARFSSIDRVRFSNIVEGVAKYISVRDGISFDEKRNMLFFVFTFDPHKVYNNDYDYYGYIRLDGSDFVYGYLE